MAESSNQNIQNKTLGFMQVKSKSEVIGFNKIQVISETRMEKKANEAESFLDRAVVFVNKLIAAEGDINSIESDFPFISFGIEFIERSRVLCKKKDLNFHEKALSIIKDSFSSSRKLTHSQVAVLAFMNDLLVLDEKGELEEIGEAELMDHYYKIKELIEKEYNH